MHTPEVSFAGTEDVWPTKNPQWGLRVIVVEDYLVQ